MDRIRSRTWWLSTGGRWGRSRRSVLAVSMLTDLVRVCVPWFLLWSPCVFIPSFWLVVDLCALRAVSRVLLDCLVPQRHVPYGGTSSGDSVCTWRGRGHDEGLGQ